LCINNEDESKNLENVIDQKLQLELVPFASSSFKYKKSDICSFDPYMERILKFLTQSQKRDYIIFCSRIFEQLLKNYVIDSNSFKFKFEKVDSTKSKLCYEIINLKIKFDNKELICAIAPQFAMQGCPVGNYGQMIKECYGRFEELNERKEFSPYLCNKTVQKWQKN
jgi:hypothetical protein